MRSFKEKEKSEKKKRKNNCVRSSAKKEA